MNKTSLDIKFLNSSSPILDKNELSLKRETMSEVYVSSILTRVQPFEERIAHLLLFIHSWSRYFAHEESFGDI